mgnify:CR=1 FL=1|tara:strand:- start:3425 stop:4276 length:852 start_codon:yes stop_codon:yes gene_type:complete
MKKVLVALANKKFIEHTKSLFYSAKTQGDWEGDFVIIVPESDKGKFDEKEFTDKGIEIFYGKTLPGNPKPHYYKYYLWTEHFKQWDWIFYCDLDVLFFNKIEFGFLNDTEVLYANDCNGTLLNFQFEYRGYKVEKFDQETRDKYDKVQDYVKYPSFQSCYMIFHKNFIKDDTFKKLINLHNEYYVYYNDLILDGLTEEQSILNLAFIGEWDHLGSRYMNTYKRANELEWNFDEMLKPYKDIRDYTKEGIISVHFYQFFQPWSEHNETFYPVYTENVKEFNLRT